MSGLKNFILKEQVRASHAAKFMNYEEKYHHKLATEARRALIDAWKQVINPIQVNPDAVARALEKNADATTKLEVIEHPERASSARFMGQRFIGPSVKIPAMFPTVDRASIARKLMTASRDSLERVIKQMSKILDLDSDLPTLFRVVADEDDVRLQFVSKKAGHETSKTIFKVTVEHGRPGSKTKDFDRVFFIDNLLR